MKEWHQLVLKFLAEEGDSLGRNEGEQLWPEKFSDEKVEEVQSVLGAYFFSGLYQQEPPEQKNSMFKREWFKYYNEINNLILVNKEYLHKNAMENYIIIDPAFSESENSDYTVMMNFYLDHNSNLYIDDIFRARLNAGKLIKNIASFIDKHNPLVTFVESVAAQKIIASELKNKNYNIKAVNPDRNKELRAIPASVKLENGKIFLKRGDWNIELEKELLAFPNGKHDDQVDCLAYAVSMPSKYFEMPRGRSNRINLLDI